MAGLMLALFSSVLSTMIVTNALPTIVRALDGDQTQYTWLVTASLLTMTVSTPVWGKFADQFSKKALMQTGLVIFVAGSVGAGLSHSIWLLVGMRAVQGVAMGCLLATTQAVIGSIVPPRQGGRYASYIGAVMACATLCGPLIGGVITDTPWLGWRWCFFVVVPLAVISLVILQRYLTLPTLGRKAQVDYAGAILIAATASTPLLWVTFAGDAFSWASWQSGLFLGGTLVAGFSTFLVERRHPEPIIAFPILRDRTTALAIVGSGAVGVVMFSTLLFLSQYFQVARGYSATEAAVLGVPMMVGTTTGTLGGGHLIATYGRWKPFLVGGSAALALGLLMLGRIGGEVPWWYVIVPTVLVGLGLGMLIQNYVLAVQNTVDVTQVGAASALVAFFRSLGGVIGVSLLGVIVTHQVRAQIAAQSGLAPDGGTKAELTASSSPAMHAIVQHAYAEAIATVFVVAAGVALVSVAAAAAIKAAPLRTTIARRGEG